MWRKVNNVCRPKKRTLAKTITWRVTASLTTFLIAWMLITWYYPLSPLSNGKFQDSQISQGVLLSPLSSTTGQDRGDSVKFVERENGMPERYWECVQIDPQHVHRYPQAKNAKSLCYALRFREYTWWPCVYFFSFCSVYFVVRAAVYVTFLTDCVCLFYLLKRFDRV